MNSGLKVREIRVEMYAQTSVSRICVKDDHVINLDKLLPIDIVNISASGVLLHSTLNLPKGLNLYLNLPIGNTILPCVVEVVRKENNCGKYYYGCKLFLNSEVEKARIRKFVFSKQVENLRKKSLSVSRG